MSSTLSAELAATCNALGYLDPGTNKYYADSNTLETVKDLIRYLRRDDESHDIRRHLGETQVLQTDLLPLLKSYWEETDLFDVLLRLLVNLTSPALMLWQEKIPTEKTARNHYLQIEEHLQMYKQAFADEAVWAVLSTKLSKILETDFAERGDENSLIIERILILIRNVLYVPANPDAEKRPDNDASVHDQVLWALHQSGMLDIILFITSSSNEQAYYMHVLEILSFMLREQSASELANAALQRSQTEKMRDEAELLAVRHRETNQKQQKIKMYNGARHSRFGGTFVVKSMKSISDNELIYHKPLNRLDALNFDVEKKKPKTPKNRLPVRSSTSERRSAFSIRLFLKEFCIEFLNGAYNTLMYHVKDNIVRQKFQDHDESYYLWAMRFFMEFNRSYKFEVKLVSETMSIQSFHFVQQQIETYFDTIAVEKKNFMPWSKRMHLALLAYRELLLTLMAMDKSPDGTVRDSSKVIKSNIFYVVEYRELIVTLLITFDELKLSLSYLKDLLETQHVFVRMFQGFCEKYGDVVVQQKSKARRKKKKKAPAVETAVADVTTEMNLDALWDEAAPQLSAVLQNPSHIPTDVVPFDAASDLSDDEQKSNAMKNIQRLLRENEFENALGLLRAAREVWPENDSFGSSTMAPEEELLALRDIFFADLGENAVQNNVQPQQEDTIGDDEEENEEELEGIMNMSETSYKFSDFIKRLCHPRVVRACGLALRNFEQNSVQTNHCIVKLLHRIAWDWKMHGMVFQVSIFRTFQKIYASKSMPQYKELVKFATYILRRFFELTETNSKIFMEALFWKSTRDAIDLEEGYESYKDDGTKIKKTKNNWTELEEEELSQLFQEFTYKELEGNVVNWITNSLIDHTRSRKAVSLKLKEMGLLKDEKPRVSKIRLPRQWGEDEEVQLRELYELCKDEADPLGCIEGRLYIRRPKRKIVEKLLEMGLIQDKKEVRKKRTRKSQGSKVQDESSDDELPTDESESGETTTDSNSSDGGCDDDVPQNGTVPKRRTKDTRRIKTKKSVKSRKNKSTRTSTENLIKLLKRVADMTEALDWLKESFSDVADDLEENPDDNDEGVPLVAIFECSLNAMEDENFLKLLRGFGIKEPADEQETHWRIPSNLTADTLRQYCQLLVDTIENKLPETSNLETNVQPDNQGNSSDEEVFDKLRKIVNDSNKDLDLMQSQEIQDSNHSSSPLDVVDSTSSTRDTEENVSKASSTFNTKKNKNSATQRKKRSTVINSDEESENSHNPSNADGNNFSGSLQTSSETTDNFSSSGVAKKALKRKRKIVAPEESDDEDEDFRNFKASFEDNVNIIPDNQKAKRKRNVLDSGSEDDTSEKENVSESEQNKHSSETRLSKMRRNRIASDDEDV